MPIGPDNADRERIHRALTRVGIGPHHTDAGATITLSASEAYERPLPAFRTRSSNNFAADLELGPMLGEGGMGIVQTAHQNSLDRDVAVKYPRHDKDAEAILHEGLVMGYVEHPNVVPVHAVGRTETGAPMVVMKRIEGVSWKKVLEDPLSAPVDVVDQDFHLNVLIQVCNVLRFSHERGIVHRDIKPENVMLGSFGEVYVVDWGIAVSLKPHDGPRGILPREAARALAGTPLYMAPESAGDNIDQIDERTDVFLLGATLYEILTGKPPNQADTSWKAVIEAFKCPAKEFPTHVDPELQSIARRAMAREREYRFQSVAELQEALRSFLSHRESLKLTRVAQRNYDEIIDGLKAADDGAEPPTKLLVETRFALRHALSIWPDNRRAREILAVMSRAAFEFWLHHGNLPAASEALLDISEAEKPDCKARLAVALENENELRREVKDLRFARDQKVDSGPRLVLGLSISAVWGLIAWYKAISRWGVPLEELEYEYLWSLLPTIGIPLIAVVGFRSLFVSNEFNRRMMYLLFAGLFGVAMVRIAAWRFDVAVHVATAIEYVLYALLAIVVSIQWSREMLWASGLIVGAAILAVLVPTYQAFFMALAFTIFVPLVARIWRDA